MRNYWIDIGDGKKEPDNEAMVAKLLDDGVLFLNSRKYYCEHAKGLMPETLVLFVLCNDTFAWGCADAEEVTTEELPKLFEMHEKDPVYGSIRWVCIKRGEKPQKPIADRMRTSVSWDEEVEKLAENSYDNIA